MRHRSTTNALALKAPGRGRPRKFNRSSRAVTLTLPDDIIAVLESLDRDLSRAVVRAVLPLAKKTPKPVELVNFGRTAVIIVPSNSTLRERTGVELVPLVDGRALIALGEGLSPLELELRLRDALVDPSLNGRDRALFETIGEFLTNARRGEGVALQQRSIIVLQWRK